MKLDLPLLHNTPFVEPSRSDGRHQVASQNTISDISSFCRGSNLGWYLLRLMCGFSCFTCFNYNNRILETIVERAAVEQPHFYYGLDFI